MRLLATLGFVSVLLVNISWAEEDTAKCPWELSAGKWQLADESGDSSTVVWKAADGGALIGTWQGDYGKATELVGWRPDTKELVAVGFGENGTFWNIVFTTVTESKLKGKITEKRPGSESRTGVYEITKESDRKATTRVVWKDADGNKESVRGAFTRLD